jgi:hypothetical protein
MPNSFILLPSFGSLLFLLRFGSLWWGFLLHMSLLSCMYLWAELHSDNMFSSGCSEKLDFLPYCSVCEDSSISVFAFGFSSLVSDGFGSLDVVCSLNP